MEKAEIELIADRYLDSLYYIAVNYCKNADDASDAVQNAFLKLINTDTVFTDDEHVRRWLIRVTINECKRFWQSFWRRNIVSLEMLHDANENDPIFRLNEDCDPVSANEIWEAVTSLPSKYSVVLHLHYYEGFNVAEIGEMLNLSPSNVQIRLYRGRKKLKDVLEKKGIVYE